VILTQRQWGAAVAGSVTVANSTPASTLTITSLRFEKGQRTGRTRNGSSLCRSFVPGDRAPSFRAELEESRSPPVRRVGGDRGVARTQIPAPNSWSQPPWAGPVADSARCSTVECGEGGAGSSGRTVKSPSIGSSAEDHRAYFLPATGMSRAHGQPAILSSVVRPLDRSRSCGVICRRGITGSFGASDCRGSGRQALREGTSMRTDKAEWRRAPGRRAHVG
jgi:hypothetical protein